MEFMDYINKIYEIVEQYWVIAFFVATFFSAAESFIPILPLAAIVAANAVLLGFIPGLLASTIGSVVGASLLFYITNKFSHIEFFKKHKSEKVNRVMEWIKHQDFKITSVIYACPFVPGFLFTMASGFSGRDLKSFIPGLFTGKLIYFFIVSYVSADLQNFITNPFKISLVIIFIGFAWLIGRRISLKVDYK